jgi:hypothetical protein
MRAITLWICGCAYLNFAGWTLSALHELNAGGYAVALAAGAAAAWFWWQQAVPGPRPACPKLRRRFRRGFPRAFLALAGLVLLGGLWYAPSNYDAMAYRLPRVLHWLDAGHWEWIHTVFDRLNNRSCGIEWVSAPVIALCHSTRPLFLINFISFLFLPGLVFSVFTRLGVRPRVAWHWMWLAPTGYCFLLQAASIGNDLFGAFFVLAAVDFALRARTGGGFAAFATSILAAGMMTAAKTNDLPLLLPWGVALLPSLKMALRRPLATALIALLVAGGSVLPTIYFNLTIAHDWSGTELSNGGVKHAVFYRTGANVISSTLQNVVPPVFPLADRWNRMMKAHLPPELIHKTSTLMEPGWIGLPQMQTEETAGFGLGLVGLLGASLLAVALRRRGCLGPVEISWPAAVRWASLVSLAALLTQANISATGRLFAAYYLLPCTIILTLAGHEALVRQRWWRGLAWLAFVMAAGLVVISPARPLFPRDALLKKIRALEPAHPGLVRVDVVYSTYRERHAAFAPVLTELPATVKALGYIAFDKPEASLWQPFGARRIVHVCPDDTAAFLKAEGVRYILLDADEFPNWFNCPLSQWLSTMNAVVARDFPLRVLAGKPTQTWSLVELR